MNITPIVNAKADLERQLAKTQKQLSEVDTQRDGLLAEKCELENQLERLLTAFPDLEMEASKQVASPAPKKVSKVRKKSAGSKTSTSMLDSMKQVMGTEVMTSAEVAASLGEAGLAPESKNLTAYISSVFSAAVDENGDKVFARESRGRYYVVPAVKVEGNQAVETEAELTPEVTSAERILQEVGLDSASLGLSPPA